MSITSSRDNEHGKLYRWRFDGEHSAALQMERKLALQSIESKRESSKRYLVSLTRLRNAQLPVFRLPHELLSEIFLLTDNVMFTGPHQGIRLSHVCYGWHVVALWTSRLWRLVRFHNPQKARLLLDRCRGGTIETGLWGENPIEYIQEYKKMLKPHMDRLKNFSATHEAPKLSFFLQIFEGGVFPMLTNLDLGVNSSEGNRMHMLEWHAVRSSFPALRCLYLCAVHISTKTGPFVNLAKLKLHNQWLGDEPSTKDATIEELMDMLEGCQALRVLELKYSGPRLPTAARHYPNPSRTVRLPVLEALALEDEVLVIAQILAHISFPKSTPVAVEYLNDKSQHLADIFPAIIPRDRSHFPHFANVKKLIYTVNHEFYLKIKVEPSNLAFDLNMWALDVDQQAVADAVNEVNRSFVYPFLTENLMHEMSSNTIEEIEIGLCYTPGIPVEYWNQLLSQLPSLRSIKYFALAGNPSHATSLSTEIIALCSSLMKRSADGRTYCAKLERLELHSFTFEYVVPIRCLSQKRISKMEIRGEMAVYDLGNWLITLLRDRKLQDRGIKRLSLVNAQRLKGTAVDKMKVYVDELEWNCQCTGDRPV